uniref:Uncharacterized protein TCIL3000_3_600 n=1 Tax=Trypanosoma congolense (strain IL3000) TaxID=1068625 RepID=G0UJT5_TRYCI|nr:unnamed protein product [Trypanosoma congolense IL3000]
MLNWWLILLAVICSLICLAVAIYTLFYFISEEDSEGGYFTKGLVILGMLLAMGVVLLLPLDASNARDPTVWNRYINTLNTDLMWEIVLWSLCIIALAVAPFAVFFYQAYDPENESLSKQFASASVMTTVLLFAFGITTAVCFLTAGVAQVPVEVYASEPQFVTDVGKISYNSTGVWEYLDVHVSFFTYVVGELCLLGWVAFFFYGGVGLVSVPVDFIYGFLTRPQPISATTFAQEMSVIAAKGDALLEMGIALQNEARGKISSKLRNKIRLLRIETYLLEEEQEDLIWNYKKVGGSPFVVYGGLALGIISLCLSIAWILHIFLSNTFHVLPFLNSVITGLDDVFPLFGIVVYGIFAFYLLWVTLQGQIRVGLRFVFFQIHPMKPHDTALNSLVFNMGLLLITTYAILQFTTCSFNGYIPRTSINALMNIYVINLKGIGFIIKWAQFLLIGMSLLGLLLVLVCPKQHVTKRPPRLNY